MTKEEEFRKQTEEAKFEAFSAMCEKVTELEKKNAELTCQIKRNFYCYSCKNATERCYRKEIGCPCGKYKSYKDVWIWNGLDIY